MMTTTSRIVDLLARSNTAMRADEIADAIGRDLSDVQPVLHAMDDANSVTMRNGWYRLAERIKAGLGQ